MPARGHRRAPGAAAHDDLLRRSGDVRERALPHRRGLHRPEQGRLRHDGRRRGRTVAALPLEDSAVHVAAPVCDSGAGEARGHRRRADLFRRRTTRRWTAWHYRTGARGAEHQHGFVRQGHRLEARLSVHPVRSRARHRIRARHHPHGQQRRSVLRRIRSPRARGHRPQRRYQWPRRAALPRRGGLPGARAHGARPRRHSDHQCRRSPVGREIGAVPDGARFVAGGAAAPRLAHRTAEARTRRRRIPRSASCSAMPF